MVAFDWSVDLSLPVMNIRTPRYVQMCAAFGKSFAYFTVKERLPIIITKIIDQLSRGRDQITSEYGEDSAEDLKKAIGYLSKLKNEIQTNKKMELLTVDYDGDLEEWNKLILEHQHPYYFTAVWLFIECYVYRRIKEAFLIAPKLKDFDYFRIQKDNSLDSSIEAMCLVSDYLGKLTIESQSSKDLKLNFAYLLKMTLWGNKCDLSLSAGSDVSQSTNPIIMVDLFQNNLIVDQTESVFNDLEKLSRNTEEKNKIIDIICDNAGYELFIDLCFADFLISTKLANKIRFRVKCIPWFVSDVTLRDFKHTIDKCADVQYHKEEINLNSKSLNELGKKWQNYVSSGMWTYQADTFWTKPYEFFKMKEVDRPLYRELGEAMMLFFKGDLNYRKLMAEINWPSTTPFEKALSGFYPAPLVAVRTVKADLISGLVSGKSEELDKIDEKWMEKGDYGVIQYTPKKETIGNS